MKINWELIRRQEELSFKRYAASAGYNPDVLAKQIFSNLADRILSITGSGFVDDESFDIDLSTPTITSLLEANRKAANNYADRVIGDMVTVLTKISELHPVDWDALHRSAGTLGIDVKSDGWVYEYLKAIPIVMLYTHDVEAYVRALPRGLPHVVVSRSLSQLMEILLVPLMLNMMFPEGELRQIQTNSTGKASFDFDTVSDLVIDIAKYYLHMIQDVDTEAEILKPTQAATLLGAPLYIGTQDFVYLHEYAHIVLGHTFGESTLQNEARADILAVNILLDRAAKFNRLGGTPFLFRALAPTILFHFLAVANVLRGCKVSKTHPHPFVRIKYVNTLVKLTILKDQELLPAYERLLTYTDCLFGFAYRRLGISQEFLDELDDSYLRDVEFTVIPHYGQPFTFAINQERSSGD